MNNIFVHPFRRIFVKTNLFYCKLFVGCLQVICSRGPAGINISTFPVILCRFTQIRDSNKTRKGRTDGWTDGQTDGRTE